MMSERVFRSYIGMAVITYKEWGGITALASDEIWPCMNDGMIQLLLELGSSATEIGGSGQTRSGLVCGLC